MLRKSSGNMYPWIKHTWNPIKGFCEFDCSYCYVKRFGKQSPAHLVEGELHTQLDASEFVFVGSGIDIFGNSIPDEWIYRTLEHCRKFKTKFLFQSKNPARMLRFRDNFPETERCMWATTIETNRHIYEISKAPNPIDRTILALFPNRVLTIEPVIDFDLDDFLILIKESNPSFINIGADSGNNHLPEPPKEKILALIDGIKQLGIEVKKKTNLERLL